MDSNESAVARPVNSEGREVAHRMRITERQRTAQRLLLAAAEEVYDGDLDVNWDAPKEAGAPWLPERLSTLYGSDIWASMDPVDRAELLRRELVNFLSFGIYAESALTLILFRDVAENDDLVDDVTRYSLKSIQEESRNSFMFTRLINVVGLDVYRLSHGKARALSTLAPMTPSGALSAGVVLMVQEAIHSFVRQIAVDPTVQSHVRQVMRIHEIADSRHIEFSRAELATALADLSRPRRLAVGHALAYAASRLYPMLLDARVFTDVGLSEVNAMHTARTGPAGIRTARSMTDSFVRFCGANGLFQTPTEKRILRRAGIYARPGL
ncbi:MULTISPECIES: diiron oxygenase [Gordonia]|uniref:diiron oxygenase n=1 Tax=Gordonia TaxID=2053 RepID=UPI0030FEDE31